MNKKSHTEHDIWTKPKLLGELGTLKELTDAFGGKQSYLQAVHELTDHLYEIA